MKNNINFYNDKKLFYKATSVEALVKAWTQLKNKPKMLAYISNSWPKLSDCWFKIISEKLRKSCMKYPKAKRLKTLNSCNKWNVISLITFSNFRIKIIEQAFLNALKPQFEGTFNWKAITNKKYQRLEKKKKLNIKKFQKKNSNKIYYFKMNWVSVKLFRNNNVNFFRPNWSFNIALNKIRQWKTNVEYFLNWCDKKLFGSAALNNVGFSS